jgi:hypothetical protein
MWLTLSQPSQTKQGKFDKSRKTSLPFSDVNRPDGRWPGFRLTPGKYLKNMRRFWHAPHL